MAPAKVKQRQRVSWVDGFRLQRQDQNMQRARKQEILTTKRRLLQMIFLTPYPLEIVKDANILNFANSPNPGLQIPTQSVIRSELLHIYKLEEKRLRSILASANNIVLTCELWSSSAQDSYLTVGCHFVDNLGRLKSYMLKTTSLFGDKSITNIQNQLLAVTNDWHLRENVHTVVRAGIQEKLLETKWRDMPCFANTLNVVFKHLMSDDELSKVLIKCQNIVMFLKCNPQAEMQLREIQGWPDTAQDELIMYSGERWLPWLDMLQKLDHQYKDIQIVLQNRGKTELILDKKDRKKINNMISALKPLKEATDTMKREGFEIISAMLPLLKKLMDKLEEEQRENDVARTLLSKCKVEFGDINNHKMAVITFLDPRFKNQLGGQNKKRALSKIKEDLNAGLAFSSAKELKDLLDRYMAYEPTGEKSNPLAWWKYTGKRLFGKLSELALKKLGVVSTAVPLERAFSHAGDRFCNLRSAIEPENLNMILFLNSNNSAIS